MTLSLNSSGVTVIVAIVSDCECQFRLRADYGKPETYSQSRGRVLGKLGIISNDSTRAGRYEGSTIASLDRNFDVALNSVIAIWPAESWRLLSAVTRASSLVEWSPGTKQRMKIAQSENVARSLCSAWPALATQEGSTRLTGDELTGGRERLVAEDTVTSGFDSS